MLANSTAAAAPGAAYVIAIVLCLNPHLPLNPARLPPLVATVGLVYVVHLTMKSTSCWSYGSGPPKADTRKDY